MALMAQDDVSQLKPTSLCIFEYRFTAERLRANMLTIDKCASRIPNAIQPNPFYKRVEI